MHVPLITDKMWDKIYEAAASPVLLVLFECGRKGAELRMKIEEVADEYDDRAIFLAINIDENPSFAFVTMPTGERWRVEGAAIILVKGKVVIGRLLPNASREEIGQLVEAGLGR
jgi:hypothetical protein